MRASVSSQTGPSPVAHTDRHDPWLPTARARSPLRRGLHATRTVTGFVGTDASLKPSANSGDSTVTFRVHLNASKAADSPGDLPLPGPHQELSGVMAGGGHHGESASDPPGATPGLAPAARGGVATPESRVDETYVIRDDSDFFITRTDTRSSPLSGLYGPLSAAGFVHGAALLVRSGRALDSDQ